MSNIYTCKLHKEFICAYIDTSLELSPSDYLYCETEDELLLAVEQDLHDAMDTGDVCWDDSEGSTIISDGFINEWKHLKNEASSM